MKLRSYFATNMLLSAEASLAQTRAEERAKGKKDTRKDKSKKKPGGGSGKSAKWSDDEDKGEDDVKEEEEEGADSDEEKKHKIHQVIKQGLAHWPNNINLNNFIRFLCYPTLVRS